MPKQSIPSVDPARYGVSFSIKQCRNFDVDPAATLDWLMKEMGFRRFRLMSYWNEHEQQPGVYDFAALDKQIDQIEQGGGVITLCLGARQPRWPENHWPDWAWNAPKPERTAALLAYIEKVVERYKDRKAIISYQLENEALLESFGERSEVDRKRLRDEFKLVKRLDPKRPVIMTTSTAWGIPLRRPIPDIVGFSFYRVIYSSQKQEYTISRQSPWFDKLRARLIYLIWRKPTFIHELQAEPWGPKAIWEMTVEQQDQSMAPKQIHQNIDLAAETNLYPMDLWGGEWYYWRLKKFNDPTIWKAVHDSIAQYTIK